MFWYFYHKIVYMEGVMKRIKCFLLVLMVMVIVSVICVWGVSALTYTYKWQADKALIGITFTYIVTGFAGGLSQRIMNKELKSMGKKMLEGIVTSTIFVGGLMVVSICVVRNPMEVSTRFLMIWMLLMGSTCLGRIL